VTARRVALDLLVVPLLLAVAVVLQVTIAVDLSFLRGAPDFVGVAVIAVALLRGPEVGAVVGFAAGLLLDALAGLPLGLSALVYTAVGYAAGSVGPHLRERAALRPLAVIAVGTLAARLGVLLLGFLLGSDLAESQIVSVGAIPATAISVLIAIPAYPAIRALLRRPTPAPTAPSTAPEHVSPLVV
jgi:rod shape-determining protein MreD